MGLRIRRQRSLVEMLERRQLLSTIYVDAGAAGSTHDGTSWGTAYIDLQSALTTAASGDQIDVAGGTYKPTSGTDRTVQFLIKEGVRVYGGFAGSASSNPNLRDPASYPTILSGDIGTQGIDTDNSYQVVGAQDGSTVDGLTITGGYANHGVDNNYDAGMAAGAVTINDCIFTDNIAEPVQGVGGAGGALSILGASTVTNCEFLDNSAPALSNQGFGGAIYIVVGGSATIVNSIFIGNSANQGGAICGSNLNLYNCDFVDNSASVTEGAFSGTATITNCVFWGNQAPTSPQLSNDTSDVISYSDVEGAVSGPGSINADPQFIRNPSSGTDSIWGTSDDDFGNLQLQQTSPCIDAGNNASVPAGTTADIAGNARFIDVPTVADTGSGTAPVVDMGAYEALPIVAALSGGPYSVIQGKSVTLDGSGLSSIPGVLQYNWDFSGDGQFADAHGANAVFSAANLTAPATVPIELQVTNADGQTSIADTTVNVVPAVIYVDQKATGANNGSDWNDASTSLAAALAQAVSGQTIHVAAGKYYPTTGTDRTATFSLKSGVEIDGGYDGSTSSTPDSRRFDPDITILSGDIGSDSDWTDNSYNVVTADNVDSTALLDGVTVVLGYASNSAGLGGGIYISNASPTIRNCFIIENFAANGGGGIYDLNASPTITNTYIGNNSSSAGGAGIRNDASSPEITGSRINANNITGSGDDLFGGGMVDYNNSSPVVTSTEIANNHAPSGGGIYDSASDPTFSYCRIIDNYATTGQGGGVLDVSSMPIFTNCTFTANFAFTYGGAISGTASSYETLTNCILWNDRSDEMDNEIFSFASGANVTYSDVQGGLTNIGNINADPKFAIPVLAGMDNVLGTEDDDGGDEDLLDGSPCISAGAGSIGAVDMGCYAYSNNPIVTDILPFKQNIQKNGKIALTATVVSQSTSDPVVAVEFYVDSNSDLSLDVGDAILGKAEKTKSGWVLKASSAKMLTGDNACFAVATTKTGLVSEFRPNDLSSVDVASEGQPSIGNLTAKIKPGKSAGDDKVSLSLSGVGGSVKGTAYFVDSNDNGVLDPDDQMLFSHKGKSSHWSGSFQATPGGTYLFFAEAEGPDNLFSNVDITGAIAPA